MKISNLESQVQVVPRKGATEDAMHCLLHICCIYCDINILSFCQFSFVFLLIFSVRAFWRNEFVFLLCFCTSSFGENYFMLRLSCACIADSLLGDHQQFRNTCQANLVSKIQLRRYKSGDLRTRWKTLARGRCPSTRARSRSCAPWPHPTSSASASAPCRSPPTPSSRHARCSLSARRGLSPGI